MTLTQTLSSFRNKILANVKSSKSWYDLIYRSVYYLYRKGVVTLFLKLCFSMGKKLFLVAFFGGDKYKAWKRKHRLIKRDYSLIKEDIKRLVFKPEFAVFLWIGKNEEASKASIQSIMDQLYANWKLFIVLEQTDQLKPSDSRIYRVDKKGDKWGTYNQLLATLSEETYVISLEGGDQLSVNAFYEFAKKINQFPQAGLIYSDEDHLDKKGNTHSPCFKPDWSPHTFLSKNYMGNSFVVLKSALSAVEGWDSSMGNAATYDMIMKLVQIDSTIHHIAKVLYHVCRREVMDTSLAKEALKKAMKRRGRDGYVNQSPYAEDILIPEFDIPSPQPKVSIIIPTKDKIDVLRKCIDSIFSRTIYINYEVVLLDNNSSDEAFFNQVETWKTEQPGKFSCHRTEHPFNFAYLMNFGASKSNGEYYVLLNNDTEIITPEWIHRMLSYAQLEETGAVGVKLLYEDNTIQHAGIVLGIYGIVSHVFIAESENARVYEDYIHRIVNFSAVTAACLMISKAKFDLVKGFSEDFEVEYNDIDFCLKLKERGLHNVYLPHVKLYHYESVSRGHPYATPEAYERHLKENNLMKKTWKKYIDRDPCYNPNLTLNNIDMSVAY